MPVNDSDYTERYDMDRTFENSGNMQLRMRYGTFLLFAMAVLALMLFPHAAFASGSGVGIGEGGNWVGALDKIVRWLQGPIAKAIATILFIITGLMVAFGEAKGFLAIFLRISFGLSIVFAAGAWLSFLFPSAGSGIG